MAQKWYSNQKYLNISTIKIISMMESHFWNANNGYVSAGIEYTLVQFWIDPSEMTQLGGFKHVPLWMSTAKMVLPNGEFQFGKLYFRL